MNAEGTGIAIGETVDDMPTADILGNVIGVDATVTVALPNGIGIAASVGDNGRPDRRQRSPAKATSSAATPGSGSTAGNRGPTDPHPGQHHRHGRLAERAISGIAPAASSSGAVHDGTAPSSAASGAGEGQRHRVQRRQARLVPGGRRDPQLLLNRVTVRGNRIYDNSSRGFAPDFAAPAPNDPLRRGHGRQQSPELSDHHRRRLRSADRRPRDAEQHAVDDLRRRLLRERRLRHAADRLPAGPGLRRLHAGHDERLRAPPRSTSLSHRL